MFQIDRFGRKPIYEQIIEQTEQLIASGVLHEGDQLPSVRALSQSLAANPNTLQKAYADLGYQPGDLPVSETVARRFLTLPMFPEMTEEQVDQVTDAIREFCVK